ncbi:MAG TPA: hypothetical protein VM469_03095 [Pseudoxanthomonas sp.]|nr:hypothetical protein [Pseudoxanthomonas sp.]
MHRITGLALCVWPMSVWAGDLVGQIVPPYPQGLHDIGGSCMTLTPGYAHICDYSVGVLADAANDDELAPVIRWLVAGRMVGRDGSQARWLITDAVAYPKTESGYHLQMGSCRLAGREDGQVIAVVRDDSEGELLKDVHWARRVALPAGKFVELDPRSVDCLNEAYLGL